MAASMARRQSAQAQPRSLEEIAQGAFGSAFRSVRREGDTAVFEFAPLQDLPPDSTLRRIYKLGGLAVPPAFRDTPHLKRVRLVALDGRDPSRRLVVFTVTREASQKIDWQHLTAEAITANATVEHLDPQFGKG